MRKLFIVLASMVWTVASANDVYLEDERDLGNGFKLCIYSEGVTITVRDHQLCPLSIEA